MGGGGSALFSIFWGCSFAPEGWGSYLLIAEVNGIVAGVWEFWFCRVIFLVGRLKFVEILGWLFVGFGGGFLDCCWLVCVFGSPFITPCKAPGVVTLFFLRIFVCKIMRLKKGGRGYSLHIGCKGFLLVLFYRRHR